MSTAINEHNINDDDVKFDRALVCSELRDIIEGNKQGGDILECKAELLRVLGVYRKHARGCFVDFKSNGDVHVYLFKTGYNKRPREGDLHGHSVIAADGTLTFQRLPGEPHRPDAQYYLSGYGPTQPRLVEAS